MALNADYKEKACVHFKLTKEHFFDVSFNVNNGHYEKIKLCVSAFRQKTTLSITEDLSAN